MQIRFSVDDSSTLQDLYNLTPRQFMIAWTTAIRQYVEKQARQKIGGDFGDDIARHSILTDTQDPERPEIYTGGENGYIAEHIHTGGIVRPKTRKYLAVPVDKSVKGLWPREYPGDLVMLRKKDEGPNGRAYLAKPMKTKIKPLWILLRQVTHKPRPWWPDEVAIEGETIRFFRDNF